MKKNLPKGLYAILDLDSIEESSILQTAEIFLREGAPILQLRAKKREPQSLLPLCQELRKLTSGYGAFFVMNDSVNLALRCGADGVHLGSQDLDAQTARKRLGPNFTIGLSTHNLDQVEQANPLSIDYIGFGPIFSTSSKEAPDPVVGTSLLKEAVKRSRHPVVAIGGIHLQNLEAVLAAQPHAIAMIQGLLSPTPSIAVREILKKLS
ncbi:MAG: thiamine phosphate synthase [Deltaproteobacteria bacterium]|nr:thiamine phosphate synthase [Deltaproteobacteria bacterium]